jgi:transcriptional regulator with PAS, ATPase and Fis domain
MKDETPAGEAAGRAWTRSRDKRAGLGGLLAYLHVDSADGNGTPSLRARFEEGLRRLLHVRSVHLRDGIAVIPAVAGQSPAEAICLQVPPGAGGRAAMLQATFDTACGLDDWDVQVLHAAAQLASLVLDAERARGMAEPAVAAPVKWRRDNMVSLVGTSHRMQALRSRIERIANTDFTVLIEGESGSGKELVARQIHELSRRRRGPFVAVNCAALVETLLEAELFGIEDRTATGVRGRRGKFESADGGTLFLDEVSDLSATAQAKLLRAIQDLAIERVGAVGAHRIDTRIVVATNRGLADLVERRAFRSDLYYRLSGVDIHVPPLRERREDIVELARHFLHRHKVVRDLTLSGAAADALVTYDWPGNVRELERVIERAIALASSNCIELDDLPPALRGSFADVLLPSITGNDTMRAWGSRYARLVLDRCQHNKRQACRVLGISYHTLQAYLRYNPSKSLVEQTVEEDDEHEFDHEAGTST